MHYGGGMCSQPILPRGVCKQAYGGSLALLAYGAFCGQALAYIDPASGSLAMQLLLGAAFSALATVKLWWAKVKALFSREGN
jgi:hypothetical protein